QIRLAEPLRDDVLGGAQPQGLQGSIGLSCGAVVAGAQQHRGLEQVAAHYALHGRILRPRLLAPFFEMIRRRRFREECSGCPGTRDGRRRNKEQTGRGVGPESPGCRAMCGRLQPASSLTLITQQWVAKMGTLGTKIGYAPPCGRESRRLGCDGHESAARRSGRTYPTMSRWCDFGPRDKSVETRT